MRIIASALLLMLALTAPGCETSAPFEQSLRPETDLDGHQWELVELGGHAVSLPPDGKAPFVRFDTQAARATGHTGCNNFFGGISISGGNLSFQALGSTKMACPEPLMSLEQRFLQALGETSSYILDGKRLLLLSGSTVLAQFQ